MIQVTEWQKFVIFISFIFNLITIFIYLYNLHINNEARHKTFPQTSHTDVAIDDNKSPNNCSDDGTPTYPYNLKEGKNYANKQEIKK